jgi:DNA uptake protein ComE-like DNA-binding protein
MVDLNSASLEQLQTLPGVDLRAAYDLLLWRPYLSWEEVAFVPGFDRQRIEEIKDAGAVVGLPRSPSWLVDARPRDG